MSRLSSILNLGPWQPEDDLTCQNETNHVEIDEREKPSVRLRNLLLCWVKKTIRKSCAWSSTVCWASVAERGTGTWPRTRDTWSRKSPICRQILRSTGSLFTPLRYVKFCALSQLKDAQWSLNSLIRRYVSKNPCKIIEIAFWNYYEGSRGHTEIV